MDKKLMKCGHISNSFIGDNKPCCVICLCVEVDNTKNDTFLENRKAKCGMCNNKVDSKTNLAFFEYKKDNKYDGYYCGCRGWN